MAEVTVKQLADVVGTPIDRLLEQIKDAGLAADSEDALISDKDKMQLLQHLRTQHGKLGTASTEAKPRKITLKRKTVSELKVGSAAGRSKTVAVEVRRKRNIQKPADVATAAATASDKPKELEELDQLRVEQARREAERQREQDIKRERADARENEEREQQARRDQAKAATEQNTAAPVAAPADAAKTTETRRHKPVGKKGRHEDEGRKSKEETLYGRGELHISGGGHRKKKKTHVQAQSVVAETKHGFERPVTPVTHEVVVPETITVDALAKRMSMKAAELIKELMKMGVMATINQVIDQDTAALVVEELGHKVVMVSEDDAEKALLAREETATEQLPRPPVVTIMGHVDHGKTSLLDYIRTSKIASGEAGGITQHIGAYHVETGKGVISFIDTPGHAAFTSMRSRGANVTDIVILVVAADDGVMPQTVEALQHAQAAKVPIIIAVNKIDKPQAQPDRVKTELGQYGIIPEDWGGDNVFVNVSALTGAGIDELLEAIILRAEVMELKATVNGLAKGVVLEATLDRGRGVTTTVLVQSGQLKKGDIMLAGEEFGRVRAMYDEHGQNVESAGPSIPVAVVGLSSPPSAGDDMLVVADERTARDVAAKRKNKTRNLRLASQQQTKLDSLFDQMKSGAISKLNILLKADVQGTLEAIRDSLVRIAGDNGEVDVAIVGSGVGGINETDISLAAASNAIVIGFNVRADASARRAAAERGVEINYYSIIYELIDNVKQALIGMLAPEYKEDIIGMAKVQEVFRSPKFGQVAGSLVTEGVVKRSKPIRVLRDNVVIFEGELESLRRFKDDVDEVKSGTECGIAVKNYDVKVGDQIEVFDRTRIERTL
jgi:translation initiation factor IF-2